MGSISGYLRLLHVLWAFAQPSLASFPCIFLSFSYSFSFSFSFSSFPVSFSLFLNVRICHSHARQQATVQASASHRQPFPIIWSSAGASLLLFTCWASLSTPPAKSSSCSHFQCAIYEGEICQTSHLAFGSGGLKLCQLWGS